MSQGDPRETEALAAQVDELMTLISSQSNLTETGRVAVLACLHMADRLRQAETTLGRVDDRSRRLSELLAMVEKE